MKIIVDKEIKFDIIEMHVENAAVVQRLVHLIAIQMMTVRFRSVAPLELSIADTKVLAIFSFIGINTANINDLYGISTINIAVVVYIAFI